MLVIPAKAAAGDSTRISVASNGMQGNASFPAGKISSPAVCPLSIGFGETIQCSISASGEKDSYTFSASANDKVLVRMVKTNSADTLFPGVRIYNRGGINLCEAGEYDTANIDSCTLTSTGTYSILAFDQDVIYTGNYSLSLSKTSRIYLPLVIL
jgi:hypothetical protein